MLVATYRYTVSELHSLLRSAYFGHFYPILCEVEDVCWHLLLNSEATKLLNSAYIFCIVILGSSMR